MKGVALKDKDGNVLEQLHLSDFGINTLGYFNAPDNEKNAYHIDGDPDDTNTSGNGDKLKTAIANDPERVVSFFTQLSKNLSLKFFIHIFKDFIAWIFLPSIAKGGQSKCPIKWN